MRYSLLLSLFLLFQTAFCDLKDPDVLAATEGEPSAMVAGCVSAITGDFCVSQEDIFVTGVEPIHFQRSYVSGDGKGTFGGWSWGLNVQMTYFMVPRHKERSGKIILYEPSGTQLKFTNMSKFCKNKKDSKHIKPGIFRLNHREHGLGLSNNARGEMSGRSNFKNDFIEMAGNTKSATLHQGDGSVRFYRRISDEAILMYYRLEWERLPSGNFKIYRYHKADLVEIRTTNPAQTKTYAWIRFHYHGDRDKTVDIDIETSDGKRYTYYHERKKEKYSEPSFFVNQVIHAENPEERVSYHPEKDDCGPLLEKRILPNGRQIQAHYYRRKWNSVFGTPVEIKEESDPRRDRVMTLHAPVGDDAALIPLYRFFYTVGKKRNHGGSTEVYDAYNIRTLYSYSPEMRLTEIRYNDNGNYFHHGERFHWGAEDSPNASNLLARSLIDEKEETLFCRYFAYDSFGNITRENFMGDLSGQGDRGESHEKRFFYTSDGQNLLLRQEENNQPTILYNYLPGTNRLLSKFVCDQDKIQIRTFYEYNEDLILVREITDDGTSSYKDDLSTVTTRLIKVIHPRNAEPFLGLPEIIEERYLDENGQESLLKKTIISYSPSRENRTKGHLRQHKYVPLLPAHQTRWQRQSRRRDECPWPNSPFPL